LKAARAIVAVVDKMHLVILGIFVFVVGVLFLNSVLALIISIILIVMGFIGDTEVKKSADLSYLFLNNNKTPNEEKVVEKAVEFAREPPKVYVPEVEPNWTVELFQQMDWKRYEELCSAYFFNIGFKPELTGLGADEGVDIYLYEQNIPNPTAIVQCKSYSNPVGVNLIREFVGVMTHKKVSKGYFMTASKFHQPAIVFAKQENVELICGNKLIKLIRDIPIDEQRQLFKLATNGDYLTPTCASCGVKMILRKGKGKEFWGCRNYPKCKSWLSIKKNTNKQLYANPNTMLY
jgi:restriction system protein